MTYRGIPAIETRYADHRFRSRTEARWAIFFDHAGIAWEYEPQGVDLASGLYLPDFYLPQLGAWFEVKGSWDHIESVARFHDLALISNRHVLVVADRPTGVPQVQVFTPRESLLGVRDFREDRAAFVVPILGRFSAIGHRLGILVECALGLGPEEMIFLLTDAWTGAEGAFADAVRAAQDARFEHGEQHNNGPFA